MREPPINRVRFGATIVIINNQGSITYLPNNGRLVAHPQDTDSYRATARAAGYGDDTLKLCQEHDYLHALLAEALGLPASPALMGAVQGAPTNALTGAEEDMVLATQRFLNLWRAERAKENASE